jgi:tetraacyldisaccharide 4'-kinase
MQPRDVWYPKSLAASLVRTALIPASWLYSLGWTGYRSLYQFSIKKSAHPHFPIVCIGNLVVGGLGKTPLTMAVAKLLRQAGYKVVIGCSGYGSPRAEAATVAPDGELDPAEWGDEPTMIRWLMPDVPIIVGRRRVLAAELAAKHFGDHVLLMDDGMQHLPLRKDIVIALDEEHPKNCFCLPAGPYREPRRYLHAADLVIPSTIKAVPSKTKFVNWDGQASEVKAAHLLCAIGVPEQFERSIRSLGVDVLSTTFLGDHDPLTAGTLWENFPGDGSIVVTAKDYVKLRKRGDVPVARVHIALRETEITPETEFVNWLVKKIDEVKQG